jgi:phosphate-selective porin OprO and OprP
MKLTLKPLQAGLGACWLWASACLYAQGPLTDTVYPSAPIQFPIPTVPAGGLNWHAPGLAAVGIFNSPTASSLAARAEAGSKPTAPSGDEAQRLQALEKQVDQLVQAEQKRQDKESKLPSTKIAAQLQSDFYWFGQDAANRAAVGDMQDGSAFRRARIGVAGKYGPSRYQIEFDWALANRPSFLDVWVGMNDIAGIDLMRVGHFFEPFSLERVTPNRHTVFLERSLVDSAFAPARNMGLMAQDEMSDEHGTWAVGVFRTNSDGFGDDVGDGGERALTGRATRLLWMEDSGDSQSLLHVGGAYSFRDADNRQSRFRSQPEARVGALVAGNVPAFVDTGNIPTDYFQLWGLEAAWVEGPFSTQAEYVLAPVNAIGAPNALLQGWYGQVSYFLTGEQRPYKKSTATFDRVVPRSNFVPSGAGRLAQGPGAWEIAARVSSLDLNDAAIAGGTLTDLTFGTNWHLNPFLKVSFNYVHAILERVPVGESTADIFALRANYDF